MKRIGFWVTAAVLIVVSAVVYMKVGDEANSYTVNVLSFFGPPGGGKGTFANLCVKELGFESLSTGDVCRKHIQERTKLGKKVKPYVESGKLIPDDLVTDMVLDWLKERLDSGKNLILDGFPRTKGQAELFKKRLDSDKILANVYFQVVHFDLAEDEIVKRISNRLVCSNKKCQAIYSQIVKLPRKEGICDECGEQVIKRKDDEESVVRARLQEFAKFRDDLLGFYGELEVPIISFVQLPKASVSDNFSNFKKLL